MTVYEVVFMLQHILILNRMIECELPEQDDATKHYTTYMDTKIKSSLFLDFY